MINLIENYFNKLETTITKINKKEIENFVNLLIDARDKSKTIYVMGNGGSATTASHFTCDIAKGTSHSSDKKFKIICLNDNIATVMAYANDVNYEDIFSEQLKTLEKDDLVIAFSGSGNSKNILKAIDLANKTEAITFGITGYDGGILKRIAKYSFNANIDDMQVSEDLHLVLIHIAMQVINSKCT